MIGKQRALWQAARTARATHKRESELNELQAMLEARKVNLSCSGSCYSRIETVSDVVDIIQMLRAGFDVGFEPCAGMLSGFAKPVELRIVRGETPGLREGYHYTGPHALTLGIRCCPLDFANTVGKLLATKRSIHILILDCTAISENDEKALAALVYILNMKACRLLSRMEIINIIRNMGEIKTVVVPYGDPEWVEFAKSGMPENALLYYHRPSATEMADIFKLDDVPMMLNGQEAQRRAPWFRGVTGGHLHANKSLCAVSQTDASQFEDLEALMAGLTLAARATYRTTCASLPEGIQATWGQQNDYMRLCCVELIGATGMRFNAQQRIALRKHILMEAYSMADEVLKARPQVAASVWIDHKPDEPALIQLERYISWVNDFTQHNIETVITYEDQEVPDIIKWLQRNWSNYIGVKFKKK